MLKPATATDAQAMSLLEIATRRGGIRKGAKATEVVVTWSIAVEQLGHPLGTAEGEHLSAQIREYAAYWKTSERTAWRDLGRFREVFPEEESPARLAAIISAVAADRREQLSRGALGNVRLVAA